MKKGEGYSDVLIMPRSGVESRARVSTTTTLAGGLKIDIPIISANMDTVTEADMAIAIARLGGFGVIHRFNAIDDQAGEVKKVKKAEVGNGGGIKGNSSKPSVDGSGRLLVGATIGINEDWFERARALVAAGVDVLVIDIANADNPKAIEIIKKVKAEIPSIPLMVGKVATRMSTRKIIEAGADAVKVGIGGGSVCTTRQMTGIGVPQFTAVQECVKEAMRIAKKQTRRLRRQRRKALFRALRGDLGSKKAMKRAKQTAKAEIPGETPIPIVADGSIKFPGDVTKALAVGASTVMLGRMFAGTDESPGEIVEREGGEKYKVYRGMASLLANIARRKATGEVLDDAAIERIVPEGLMTLVPYVGSVREVITNTIGGVCSGMTYVGAEDLGDLRRNARFVRLAPGAREESYSRPPDLSSIRGTSAPFSNRRSRSI